MDRWQHQLLLLHKSLKVPAENDRIFSSDHKRHVWTHCSSFPDVLCPIRWQELQCSFFLLLLSRSCPPCSRNSTESQPSLRADPQPWWDSLWSFMVRGCPQISRLWWDSSYYLDTRGVALLSCLPLGIGEVSLYFYKVLRVSFTPRAPRQQ